MPYKGSAALTADLVAGHVPAAVTVLSQLVPLQQDGTVRVLATSGASRSAIAPQVPTFKELGFPAIQGTGWQAFHTTAGTPRPIVDRLSAAIAAAIRSTEVSRQLLAAGLEPVGSTADELARRIAEDTAKWAPIVRISGFRADE